MNGFGVVCTMHIREGFQGGHIGVFLLPVLSVLRTLVLVSGLGDPDRSTQHVVPYIRGTYLEPKYLSKMKQK